MQYQSSICHICIMTQITSITMQSATHYHAAWHNSHPSTPFRNPELLASSKQPVTNLRA